MIRATRVMYLMSGILIMVSGLYIQLNPWFGISELLRVVAGLLGIVYFGYQLYRFLVAEFSISSEPVSVEKGGNFGLDFIDQ